ncbi:MAG: hypothetical protein ACKPKO_43685 [Candidatus Fonsibacter sp.]
MAEIFVGDIFKYVISFNPLHRTTSLVIFNDPLDVDSVFAVNVG